MLRVNADTGNIYGFLDEGGYVDFSGIPSVYGEVVLTVKGNNVVQKRSLIFGQTDVSFIFTEQDISSIGVGSHRYTLQLINEEGQKSTIVPDASSSARPTFNIEE